MTARGELARDRHADLRKAKKRETHRLTSETCNKLKNGLGCDKLSAALVQFLRNEVGESPQLKADHWGERITCSWCELKLQVYARGGGAAQYSGIGGKNKVARTEGYSGRLEGDEEKILAREKLCRDRLLLGSASLQKKKGGGK